MRVQYYPLAPGELPLTDGFASRACHAWEPRRGWSRQRPPTKRDPRRLCVMLEGILAKNLPRFLAHRVEKLGKRNGVLVVFYRHPWGDAADQPLEHVVVGVVHDARRTIDPPHVDDLTYVRKVLPNAPESI